MEEEMSRRRNGHGEAVELTAPKSTKRPPGERTVNDDEVDEFFAILKRLQEVKRLKSSFSSGNESKRCGATWQPVFTLDDFKEVTNGRDRKHNARNEQDDANDNEVVSAGRFDLNTEPEMESTNC